MMNYLKSIYAGALIALGCTVYLSVENHIIGSLLFSLGLYTIILFNLNLFTGKIGYFSKYCSSIKNVFIGIYDMFSIWLGNFIGCCIMTLMIKLSRLNVYTDNFLVKNNDNWYSLLILGIFCGALMYIAVEGYKIVKNPLIVIMPVMVFILCGFEHCVADMAYFFYNNDFKINSIITIIIITLGNTIGAVSLNFIRTINDEH